MPTDIDPGAVARAEAGGDRVCRGELLDTTNSRANPAAIRQELRRMIRRDVVKHLNEAADRLDYWLWNEGYEPEFLARLVRDLRSAAALLRGCE
jgi:hypothetical protein